MGHGVKGTDIWILSGLELIDALLVTGSEGGEFLFEQTRQAGIEGAGAADGYLSFCEVELREHRAMHVKESLSP